MRAHAAHCLTHDELIAALFAERLERLAERMAHAGLTRLAVFGSHEHITWGVKHVQGITQLPVTCVVTVEGDEWPEDRRLPIPMLAIDDPRLLELADAVLICDDRHEDALLHLARTHLPPRVMIHRLYERLPIGDVSLTPMPEPVVRSVTPADEQRARLSA